MVTKSHLKHAVLYLTDALYASAALLCCIEISSVPECCIIIIYKLKMGLHHDDQFLYSCRPGLGLTPHSHDNAAEPMTNEHRTYDGRWGSGDSRVL
jgi:hypothetical protein